MTFTFHAQFPPPAKPISPPQKPQNLPLPVVKPPFPTSLWITRQSPPVFSQLTMLNKNFASYHKFDYSRTPERVLRPKSSGPARLRVPFLGTRNPIPLGKARRILSCRIGITSVGKGV